MKCQYSKCRKKLVPRANEGKFAFATRKTCNAVYRINYMRETGKGFFDGKFRSIPTPAHATSQQT